MWKNVEKHEDVLRLTFNLGHSAATDTILNRISIFLYYQNAKLKLKIILNLFVFSRFFLLLFTCTLVPLNLVYLCMN
jgi:hypothetical protein